MDDELYLKLPCKLGSDIYSVGNFFTIENGNRVIKHKVVVDKFKLSMFDDVGITYFLTYEEAEEKANRIGDFIYNKELDRYYSKDGYMVCTL